MTHREPKFIADVMVGKLARWLRVLGMDVSYSNFYDDDQILQIAASEDRIVLTRDTGLAGRSDRCILIVSEKYAEHVQQVIDKFNLKDFDVFSRCLECNVALRSVEKESIFERVPPYVYLTQERFATCPACNRVYWHGTHADDMLKRLRAG